jgi:putative transposase
VICNQQQKGEIPVTNKPEKADELLDELLKGCDSPEAILGEQGLLKQLTKRLVERALEAELTEHLGYRSHAREAGLFNAEQRGHSILVFPS